MSGFGRGFGGGSNEQAGEIEGGFSAGGRETTEGGQHPTFNIRHPTSNIQGLLLPRLTTAGGNAGYELVDDVIPGGEEELPALGGVEEGGGEFLVGDFGKEANVVFGGGD